MSATTAATTGTDTRGGVTYRPLAWDDIDAIVEEFDRTWGDWGACAGTPTSKLLSRHFVMHYLVPATKGDIAERDGAFMGVTLTRVVGEPVLFPQAREELDRVDAAMRGTELGARSLDETLRWHAIEEDMERESGVNGTTQGEVELFLVSADARGHGVGGTLWRRMLAYLDACGADWYYLHTDSTCDVGFYDHKGLSCVAERYSADHPEDHGELDDIFIYVGDVPHPVDGGPDGRNRRDEERTR